MIKFRCSSCQKAIGVDEKFAGRLIKCPGCEQATKVPEEAGGEIPVAQVASLAQPATERAVEATLPHIPKAINPVCPSCNSELFNPSDTMCGICGHLLEQTPFVNAPLSPRPTAATLDAVPVAVPATAVVDPDVALPVNPAIAASHSMAHSMGDGSYREGKDPKVSSKAGTGRSVGAWFAAVGLGLFLALIWGVIATFTGPGGQVFAWAIGAIVGLIAGLIARNPSLPFCLATAAGALLCILFGRLVSAWAIMLTVGMLSSGQHYLVPDTGVSVGVMEDLNNEGAFEAEEKLLAEMKVEAFFSNKSLYEMEEYDNVDYETELAVDQKVREHVREMTDEEKEAVLERVRKDHLGWMEEPWHYFAILDSMVEGEEIDDEGLKAHALYKLSTNDGSYDGDYYQDTTPKELEDREEQLQELVMNRYAEMDSEQRAEAVKNSRLNHLSWTPIRHEYLAMLDAMYEAGDIPDKLKKRAKSTINLELSFEYDDVIEGGEVDYEAVEKENQELQALVNAELLKLEQSEVDKLFATVQKKYPMWEPATGEDLLEDLSEGIDEQIERFESDGTFSSSLKTRFKMLDFVWLTLGMISAFAIVFTLGQSGKKKS